MQLDRKIIPKKWNPIDQKQNKNNTQKQKKIQQSKQQFGFAYKIKTQQKQLSLQKQQQKNKFISYDLSEQTLDNEQWITVKPRKSKKADTNQQLNYYPMNQSLQQIRKYMDQLFKAKYEFKTWISKINNLNSLKDLKSKANYSQQLIDYWSKISIQILTQQHRNINPLKVNLHGYRTEEIPLLLDEIINMIRQQFVFGNKKIKLQHDIYGRKYTKLTLITGKGLHSKFPKDYCTLEGQNILKQQISNWCQKKSYECELTNACVQIFIRL